MKASRLNERNALWIVVALTVLNALLTGWIAVVHLEPFADLATYFEEGENIAQGKGFSLDVKIVVNAPGTVAPFAVGDRFLYPLIVAAAIRVFGDSLGVANVVSALSMCLIALPLYGLGKALFDWRAGLAAALLFMLSPIYHMLGIGGWTDLMASFFYYACLYCVTLCILAPTAGRRLPLLAGLSFALAALTREDAVVLVLALGMAWWARGRRLDDAADFAVAPLAALALRSLYVWQQFGSPFYNERSYFWLPRWALWYTLGSFTPAEYFDYVGGLGGALAIRLYNYARFIENLFSDGILYFMQVGLLPVPLIVALMGAYRWRPTAGGRWLLPALSGVMALQVLLGIGYPGYAGNSTEVRHGQLVAPFLLLLVGSGLVRLWDGAGWHRALAMGLAGIYLVFSLAQFGTWANALAQPPYRGPVVLAAEWARDHLPASAVLMTRRAAETHYFSGKTVVATPSAPFADMMAYAQAHQVTHFLITEVERSGAPNLLQGLKAFAPGFQTVYSTEGAQLVALVANGLPASLALPNELYAGKTVGRPERLFAWNDLRLRGMGTTLNGVNVWGEVIDRLAFPPAALRPLERTVNARAGENIELAGYRLASLSLRPGDELEATLDWRALGAMQTNYTVFVHLLDARGTLRAQHDSPPLGGSRPTSRWEPGEWLADHHSFLLPGDLLAGTYQLEIGLYDPAGGARVPLRDTSGQLLSEDRLLVSGVQVGE
jgi:hypothetical protein